MGEVLRAVNPGRRRSLWAVGVLVLIQAGLAVAVTSAVAPARKASAGPVHAIALPVEDPPRVPPGPNVAEFTAYCRLCHSPRLVLTQPRLTEKQWTAVVKKMESVYGAPIPPSQEPDIIAYLMAVRGAETKAK